MMKKGSGFLDFEPKLLKIIEFAFILKKIRTFAKKGWILYFCFQHDKKNIFHIDDHCFARQQHQPDARQAFLWRIPGGSGLDVG